MRGRQWVCALLSILVAALVLAAPPALAQPLLPRLLGRIEPGSRLVGCDQADQRITVDVDTHLDPTCTYTQGFEVVASDVVLDCRGAVVERTDLDGRGIAIRGPATVPLANVVVRNCDVRGFQNGIRVTRQGFKDLLPGEEYVDAFSNIRIDNTRVTGTRASGIFVDGYVTGVTIQRVEVAGAGSVGIYLEAGSKDNVVMRCDLHDNGYGDVDPAGIPIVVGGITFRYLSTGREGIAVDGSRNNRILRNRLAGNSAGGIFLYKNCGEDASSGGWWERRYGADGNLITRNEIVDAPNGVWIASRAAENQFFMDCSDPAYVSGDLVRIHEEFAKDNLVRRNTFVDAAYGVRVEDDGNRVERNRFASTDPTHQAILVGTKYRTEVLMRPVSGTVVRGNLATIAGNAAPYGWIHAHDATLFAANRSHGVVVDLRPAEQPRINPFLFAKEIWVEGSR
jgi:parallel beta-helix repeat protein